MPRTTMAVIRGHEGIRAALGSALVAGTGVPLCLLGFGQFETVPPMEGVVVSVVLASVVFVCAMLARGRGLALIWILLLGAWLFSITAEGAAPLLERFTIWSEIALPLALSTEFLLCADHARRVRRGFVLAGSAWIILVLASAYLARYAPDVGMSPRQHPVVRLLTPVLLLPGPPILSSWMIRRAITRVRRSR